MKEIKNKIIKVLALPKFSVEHPVAIAMIYTGLLVLSLAGFSRMGLDMFPDVSYPVVSVITTYQGASAEEVEAKVTRKVESQTSTVRGLKDLNSTSKEGLSVVTLKFEWGSDLDSSANDVRDKLGMLKKLLPDGADDPMVMRIDLKDIPILIMAVNAGESYPRIYNILDNDVSNMLKRIPGVGNVIIRGGQSRQINVDVDRRRLEAYGLTLSDVKRAVLANNLMQPAGNMQIGQTDYMLRVPGEFSSPQEIAGATVGVFRGQAIKIGDVAQINDSHPYESEKVMANGRTGAILMVQKRSEANAIAVAEEVRKALPDIHKRIPADIEIKPLIDTSNDIKNTLGNLTETLYVAAFLILAVILFFLRRLRPAVIVFTSIPVSLLLSFLVQFMLGYTINLVSMLAITIAIGLVVDDALVVMENQIRRQEELGEDPRTAAINATSEVGRAVTMATLASCVVFLPMMFATGMAGVMFRPLSVVMCATLLASLLASLTLSPMMSSLILRPEKPSKAGSFNKLYKAFERALERVDNSYKDLIGWTLEHPWKVVISSTSLLLVSLLLIPFIPTEFMSEQDTGQMQIDVELPVGTRVEATHKVMEQVEAAFKKVVPQEWVTTGYLWRDGENSKNSNGGMSGKSGSSIGSFMGSLNAKNKRPLSITEINEKLRREITKIPGITRLAFSGGSVTSKLTGSGKPMSVNIYGHELEVTNALAEKLKQLMIKDGSFKDVTVSLDMTRPEYHVVIDRRKAGSMGIPVQTIADTVNLAFGQKKNAVYRELGDEYDIVVRLREEDRRAEPDLESLFVRASNGEPVRLSNLASFEKKPGPLQIDREDQQRIVKVEANITGNDLGKATTKLEKLLAGIPMPAGVSWAYGGSVKEQKESFVSLAVAMALGIMLTYMIMASQFESLIIPLIIMFSLPFGFAGAIWVFALTGFSLNVTTFIGLIMMVGLVVKQAIVYLDYALQLIDDNDWDIKEALKEAGRVRLRPILMTVSAMVLGFVPMAISRKQGSEFWQPLSLAIIGGLIVSTIITLVLIPAAYYLIFRNKKKVIPVEQLRSESNAL